MEYLHLFETQVSHDSLYEGDNYKEPWIAYTLDNASVTFNKPHDYSKDYFTIEALEDGNVYFKYLSFAPTANQRYIEYSKDNGETWSRTTNVDAVEVIMTISLLTGEKALVRGDNDAFGSYEDNGQSKLFGSCFYSNIKFNVSGNIMSLLHGENFISSTNVLEYDYTFLNLFYDSWGQHNDAPAHCMIVNVKNLILPATTLAEGCYQYMFYDCTELATAPSLPATTLASYCYSGMFYDCIALTTAPELPATTLADECYSDMFSGCTALTTAPALPATTLAHGCYYRMFYGCTALTTAPELPATTLSNNCYYNMFSGCTSLTASPSLPATTLADWCYSGMFSGCTSLTVSPELPATTLAPYCYSGMFSDCTALTTATELPATTLADWCYYFMFYRCTELTTAPKLPATTLTPSCYKQMFQNCNMLNSITMLATDISASNCLNDWVSNVAATGTFIKAPSMTSLPIDSSSGIPTGWTVIDDTEYLTLTALGSGTITITIPTGIDSTYATSLSYSKNKLNWTETIIDNTEQTISIPVSSGENVYLKGIALQLYNDSDYGIRINSAANINASGNIMSLLYGDNFKDKTSFPEGSQYTFNELFKDNTHLINADNLILPATELTDYCYSHMFDGCTALTTAPELPATTLTTECYSYMFYRCTSLTTAPSLPATELTDYCYSHMFDGCTALNTAPQLPATTLAYECYFGMFKGCTALTTAPELPATTLANGCYFGMFKGCTALTTAPELPANTLADYCYYNMFQGCTSLTTAPKLPATTLNQQCYQDMFNGCTSLTTAPALPATMLANYCYNGMFYNCSNLNSITMLATDISATDCLTNWVNGVAATGTFVKASSMTSLTTGVNGIPTGWTVLDDTEYLTLSALEDGNITINIPDIINSTYATSISYSKDKSNWTKTIVNNTEQIITIPVSEGENVYLKGIAKQLGISSIGVNSIGVNIKSTSNINASGNIMSLLYGDNFKDKTLFPDGSKFVFALLFNGNTHLINAENIIFPATALVEGCYALMFSGCTLLETAPKLQATALANLCYSNMFSSCTALTTAPSLPATTLAPYCYSNMFYGCNALTTAPELPATTLSNNCYYFMFYGCTELTNAPSLPATTLAHSCYYYMFYGCTALTTAPELPATTLSNNCYYFMFSSCTALTTAPELPATTLKPGCYTAMFNGCTSLVTAPALPAMMLSTQCYFGMFYNCTSLVTAPSLPAQVLVNSCYYQMFQNCTSLTTAPELPATTLAESCYQDMFSGCSKLNSITMFATNISASKCLDNWVNGVAATGTFVKSPSMTSLPKGTSGIPSGWTVLNDTEYLTISALGSGTIMITIPSCIDSTYATSLSYSKDKSNWTKTIVDNTNQTITISVSNDKKVYLKGIAQQIYNFNSSDGIHIDSSTRINASGNVMSILYGDNFKDKTSFHDGSQYALGGLFSGNKRLINAKDLILPATTLAQGCYYRMFYGCTALTSTPPLHSIALADYCYSHMFDGCTLLNTAPALPATTLTDYCYSHMFNGCTSLTTAPALPATTLAHGCYSGMFSGCTNLITAPSLPANILATSCYSDMFSGCESLTTSPVLPAMELAIRCYDSMFRDCTSLTTAPELPATTLVSRCYCNMFYGCTSLTTVPELRATALAEGCYQYMFSGCSKLNSIAMFATDISASNCLYNWVVGVASTGVFVKAPSMTSLTTGVNGIPSGWNVVDDSDYLTLTALDNGNITITIPNVITSEQVTSLSYSKDKSAWTDTIIDDTAQTISIPVTSGDNVYLKGIAKQLGNNKVGVNINSTANINASGNVMSLLYGDNFKDKTSFTEGSQYTFRYLFKDNTHLINAEQLILPATTLTNGCYVSMFHGCTLLTIAPELPATTLSKTCYFYMFYNCSNLNKITMLATDISATSCLTNWVKNVASTGTFIKASSMTSLTTGFDGIPSGWNIVNK